MWNDVVGVNLVGSFHTAKAAIPHLIAGQRGGAIVFTSSTAGLKGFGGIQGGGLGYAASKRGRPAKEPPPLPASRNLAVAFDAFDEEMAAIDKLLTSARGTKLSSP